MNRVLIVLTVLTCAALALLPLRSSQEYTVTQVDVHPADFTDTFEVDIPMRPTAYEILLAHMPDTTIVLPATQALLDSCTYDLVFYAFDWFTRGRRLCEANEWVALQHSFLVLGFDQETRRTMEEIDEYVEESGADPDTLTVIMGFEFALARGDTSEISRMIRDGVIPWRVSPADEPAPEANFSPSFVDRLLLQPDDVVSVAPDNNRICNVEREGPTIYIHELLAVAQKIEGADWMVVQAPVQRVRDPNDTTAVYWKTSVVRGNRSEVQRTLILNQAKWSDWSGYISPIPSLVVMGTSGPLTSSIP